ncbi:TetR/AcrR family transcriptional regulator [Nocardia panacis]|uniref:TetR/AcrR family transcriptional regulator n=1 Tax=Nocardia panacis TaxID=2340916 RepID=A0A3A4JW90_9NOCA|nr:TetR/AcrR family transcriptional regulator [Nocardia panacis]RJO74769.1 TetR/AcrR family transcriptional regulator [Nocardia panacis]
MTRQRLAPAQRRRLLVAAGAELFAEHDYDAVRMEEVAAAAGVSRALLYRHFPNKRELFVAVYEHASAQLLVETELDPNKPLPEQLSAGLAAHFDYFAANPQAVLAANKVLATDPTVQSIIAGQLGELRTRLLEFTRAEGRTREIATQVLDSWLTFVRVLTVEWLEHGALTRAEMLEISSGALFGALAPLLGPELFRDSTDARP